MPAEAFGDTVTILLVDDDEIDAEAIQRAFRKARIANPVEHVSDGIEALERLLGSNGKDALHRPYLILLDLNMPRMNGIEFLEEMRKSKDLLDNVVFVLTTSDDDQDKLQAYEKQVAGYIVKTKAGEDFVNLIGMLDHYWRVVELPPEKSQA